MSRRVPDKLKSSAITLSRFAMQGGRRSKAAAAKYAAEQILEMYGEKVSQRAIEKWMDGENVDTLTIEEAIEDGMRIATMFRSLTHDILGGVTPAKIEKADLRQLMLSAAIATDKAQLLFGQPTSIEGGQEENPFTKGRIDHERKADQADEAQSAAGSGRSNRGKRGRNA